MTGKIAGVTLPAMTISAPAACLQGDANGDGKLGLADIIYMLQVLSKTR